MLPTTWPSNFLQAPVTVNRVLVQRSLSSPTGGVQKEEVSACDVNTVGT